MLPEQLLQKEPFNFNQILLRYKILEFLVFWNDFEIKNRLQP
jgi:hypothetical protein